MTPIFHYSAIQTFSDKKSIADRSSHLVWPVHILFFVALCFFAFSGAYGQNSDGVPTVELTQPEIEDKIEGIREEDGLDEETRKKLVNIYKKALNRLEEAQKYVQKTEEYKNQIEQAPSSISDIKNQLDEPVKKPDIDVPPDASLTHLQTKLSQAEANLAEAESHLNELKNESSRRPQRRTQIPGIQANIRKQLKEISDQLSSVPPDDASMPLVTAQHTLLKARKRALENKLDALQKELASYDVRKELLPLRIDLASRQVQLATEKVNQWHKIAEHRREQNAKKAVKKAAEAKKAAATAPLPIRKLAAENEKVTSQFVGPNSLPKKIAQAEDKLQQSRARQTSLESEFENVREKVETVGLSGAVGRLLLKKRADLPQVETYRRQIRRRENKISEVQFKLIELEERRTKLAVLDPRINDIINGLPSSVSSERREQLAGQAVKLLKTRRELLDSLIRDYDTYFSTLVELDTTQRKLVETARGFSSYIRRHILWVQSHPPLSYQSFPKAWEGLQWSATPSRWKGLLTGLWSDVRRHVFIYLTFLVFFLLLVCIRPHLRRRLEKLSEELHSASTDTLAHTPRALVHTLLIAIPAPVCALFLAWRLNVSVDSTTFSIFVAGGLEAVGYGGLFLSIIHALCRPNGLAIEHFRMPEECPAHLRRHLHWFALLFLPAIFLAYAFHNQPNAIWTESAGRIAYLVSTGALLVFLAVVFKPGGDLTQNIFRRNQEGYFYRSRFIWYGLLLVIPACLIIAASLGYYYSAMRLANRFHLTLMLVSVVALCHYLTVRWITQSRRRIAVERIKKKRAEAEQQAEEGEEGTEKEVQPEQPEEDLYSLSMQTRRFIQVALGCVFLGGMWVIWNEALPALGILEQVRLWSVSAGAGAEVIHITLANLFLTLIVFALAIVGARNIPGLLEMALLQRLPVDRGIRFAIRTLCRYILVIIGVVLAAAQLGVGWSRVQWLVAAMGVGLGFGLQEIFGNFISGLIILFERPMRVGDTVTVGDVFGTVTKIRIRATTIQQWDRKELIVPNKEFITGRLINWTLSDTILRLEFPVGIAYGSDIDLAEKCLYEVADQNENVSDDPPPRVIFKAFGGSSLQFELRLFIPDLDHYAETWHQINREIDRAFREADITIAFPQQDVHLDFADKDLAERIQPVTRDKEQE